MIGRVHGCLVACTSDWSRARVIGRVHKSYMVGLYSIADFGEGVENACDLFLFPHSFYTIATTVNILDETFLVGAPIYI